MSKALATTPGFPGDELHGLHWDALYVGEVTHGGPFPSPLTCGVLSSAEPDVSRTRIADARPAVERTSREAANPGWTAWAGCGVDGPSATLPR